MLWFLPIERLEERYTVMTSDALWKEFEKSFRVGTIYASRIRTDIRNGVFLDYSDTNFFKMGQLQEVARLFDARGIKNGDIFFVEDLWFPGLQSIKYMAMLYNIDVKIAGIMHAGSWTDSDIVAKMRPWARPFEESIFKMCDVVFVGSQFHKQDIQQKFRFTDEVFIEATGLPFSPEFINKTAKIAPYALRSSKEVIFPFRPHLEKGIKEFNDLVEMFAPKGFTFILPTFRDKLEFDDAREKERTMEWAAQEFVRLEMNVSKARLYSLMRGAGIVFSAAQQENYGYAVLEAVYLGCTPVLPNRLSYKEFFEEKYRYNSMSEAFGLVEKYAKDPDSCSRVAESHSNNVGNIRCALQAL